MMSRAERMMKTSTWAAAFAAAVILKAASVAAAADASPAPVLPADPDSTTHHSIVLDGRTIQYSATAGTIALKDEKGVATGRMFYVAYTQDGVANRSDRPVTFFY